MTSEATKDKLVDTHFIKYQAASEKSLNKPITKTTPTNAENDPENHWEEEIKNKDIFDVQGIDWSNLNVARQRVRDNVDRRFSQVYSRFSDGRSPNFVNPIKMKNKYCRPISYLKISKMLNCHYQIHNNFFAVSPQEFLYTSKDRGVVNLNTHTLRPELLYAHERPITIDVYHTKYMIVGCEPTHCALVDIESKTTLTELDFHLKDRQIINCLKFLRDSSTAQLQAIVGANKCPVRIYDLNNTTNPLVQFSVSERMGNGGCWL